MKPNTPSASEREETVEFLSELLSEFEVGSSSNEMWGLYDICHPTDKDQNGRAKEWAIYFIEKIVSYTESVAKKREIKLLEDIIDHYTPYRPLLDSEEKADLRGYLANRIEKLQKEQTNDN